MSTFDQYEPERFVSFKEKKTQRVVFDPKAKIQTGKYGPQVEVTQNGKSAWLNINSKRLVEQLKNFTGMTTLDITQAGSGTATTYKVDAVGKATR